MSQLVDRQPAARLDSLTGLRFFAAFAVLLDHVNGSGNSGYARIPWMYPDSLYGAHGVAFFFVLSGFVLTWSWRSDDTFGAFYWRRFARIYPAHVVATIIAVPVFYWYSHVHPGWPQIFLSLFLLQAWFIHLNPSFPGNPVSWTLSCEAFFYAVFPFAIRPLARARSGVIAGFAIACALALFTTATWAYHSQSFGVAEAIIRTPIYTIGQFFIGMSMALLLRRGHRWRVPVSVGIIALLGWILFYYQAAPRLGHVWTTWVPRLDELILPILCASIIAAAAQRDIDGKRTVFRTKPLVLLGAWSYSFYLVHKTVIRMPTIAYGDRAPSDANLFDVLGLTVCAIAAAALLYYLVEHPTERYLRNLWKRLHPREAATVQRPTAHDVEVLEGAPT